MKLFVDDIRNAPDETWTVAKTINAAINAIDNFNPEVISLDHDISHQVAVGSLSRPFPCEETFTAVATFIAIRYQMKVMQESLPGLPIQERWSPKVIIHTSNPVGARKMSEILKNAYMTDVEIKPYGQAANRLEMEV